MANTGTPRKRSTSARRRKPTPAQLKRGYRTWFFKHLKWAFIAFGVMWVIDVADLDHFGFFLNVWWVAFVVMAVNIVIGAINLVAWRGWVD